MAKRFSIKHTDAATGEVVYLFVNEDSEIRADDLPCSSLPADVYKLEEILAWWREGARLGQLDDDDSLLADAVVGVVE